MPRIAISDIKVSESFREDFGDIEALAEDIDKYGLLHPVVLDTDHNLLAGRRRLRACKHLGHSEISYTYVEAATELERREIELNENLLRKDLNWPEEVALKKAIHELKVLLFSIHAADWNPVPFTAVGQTASTRAFDPRSRSS